MSFNNTKTPVKHEIKEKPLWQIPMRVCAKNKGVMEYYLEGEIKERFISLYPIHSNRRIMQWFGISRFTVKKLGKSLGLEKDMDAIQNERIEDMKETSKKYYLLRKGKKPSQKCIDINRQRLLNGFNPWKVYKERNPETYHEAVERMIRNRKESYQKERARVLYGLPQKTKMRIAVHTLSQSAFRQKSNMKIRNNYFSVPEHVSWICYDKDTRRSLRSEATARKYGLKVVAGDDC